MKIEIPLDKKEKSDKVLKLTGYWTPPVPPWNPLKKSLNSCLCMACVVEDRLYRGLRFEGQVLLLTPVSWKNVLKYGKPDFLLMESIWNTTTGHWHMGQCPHAPGRDELLQIVAQAQKLAIPTVFWITKGHEYHEHYKDFARHFDYVFCADPRETILLNAEGVPAEDLPPCAQPAVYNPFRHYEDYDTFNLDILYDGWADLDRLTDGLKVLQELKSYGLKIIESRYQIFRRRLDVLPDYKECLLGCVSEQSRIQALRYAKAYVTLEQTLSTRTTQQWMSLEAAACRLPVVHHGTLQDDDVRKEVAIECPDQVGFLVEFVRFKEDDLYRERISHLGWRKVNQQHTFAHRLQAISKTLGIVHDWVEHPKASLITPTYRRDMLPRCLETFERQTYPNKELILVFNGSDQPSFQELGLSSPREDVKIANVPGDLFTGACLNQGHIHASGVYCFKIDDDDHYGESYIWDMILHARSVDAAVFGKPTAPLIFEGEDIVYRTIETASLFIAPQSLMEDIGLSGNSVSGTAKFFKRQHYSRESYGAADTVFMKNLSHKMKIVVACTDQFNMAAYRRQKLATHTWKYDARRLKSARGRMIDLNELLI